MPVTARPTAETRLAEHLYRRPVHRTPLVSVEDVRCVAPCGPGGSVEHCAADVLIIPRRGAFLRLCDGDEAFADAGTVLFYRRGERYRVGHPIAGGDECTTLEFAPGILAEAGMAPRDPRHRGAAHGMRSVALVPAWVQAEIQTMRARRAAGLATALEADESALAILARVVPALRTCSTAVRPRRSKTLRRQREAVHDVRATLARDCAQPVSLQALADQVGLSPFHLARVFARETGTSIHRHLVRLRLQAALERLAGGARDLTTLALDLGFASHSHFTDAFRREFGLPPSRFRRQFAEVK